MGELIDNTITSLEADVQSLRALNRADAIEQGHLCLAQAKAAFADAQAYKVISRLDAYNGHLLRANFHASRAHAFYALAAVLPE